MPIPLLSPVMLFVGTVFSFGMCAEVCGRAHLLIMHVLLLSGEYSSQITEMELAGALHKQKKTLLYPSAALNPSINRSKEIRSLYGQESVPYLKSITFKEEYKMQ